MPLDETQLLQIIVLDLCCIGSAGNKLAHASNDVRKQCCHCWPDSRSISTAKAVTCVSADHQYMKKGVPKGQRWKVVTGL